MTVSTFKVKKKAAILVPYDFGPKANSALREAVKVTKYLKGDIYLLSVVRKGDFFQQIFRSEKENRRILREAQAKLKEISKKVKAETGIPTHTIVEQGNPVDIILEQAKIIHSQYIIMGKMENSTVEFNLLGANTMHIVGEASCPVMTVSENTIKEDGFKNIVLPIDLTKQTLEKVMKAVAWAKYYKAQIHLIGVLSGGVKSTRSRLGLKMEKAQWIVEQEGVKCTAELYEKTNEPIHKVILEHANVVNGDLLMIMTHQELGVVDNYIGAVAQKILKEAEIPVVSFTSQAIEHNDYFVSGFLPFEIISSTQELKTLKG